MPKSPALKDYAACVSPGTVCNRVRLDLTTTPGTLHELAEACGISLRAASATLSRLHRCHFIEPSGLRRPSPSGRACIVWMASPVTPPRPD